MTVAITLSMICTMIRRRSGLQSNLFCPVTAYTLNQATNFPSVRTRSNLKRKSKPHCDRHLGGKGDGTCVGGREPYGAMTTDKPLSGVSIRGGRQTHSYRWAPEHDIATVSRTALTLSRSPDPNRTTFTQMTSHQGKYLFCGTVNLLAVYAITGYRTARNNKNAFGEMHK